MNKRNLGKRMTKKIKRNDKPYVIGIAGGSGSGKTTVVRLIREKLKKYFDASKIILIPYDDYYKDLSNIPFEERIKTNFDHPDSIDNELFISHLDALTNGKSVKKPIYNFKTHTRLDKIELLESRKIILVEGILALQNPAIRKYMDFKIFIDAKADIRFARRLLRDITKRKRTIESVYKQYFATVQPMHEKYVDPSKWESDIIIPNTTDSQGRLKVSIKAINALIREVLEDFYSKEKSFDKNK